MDLEDYAKKLDTDGVVVIPQVFSHVQLQQFESAANEKFHEVKRIVSVSQSITKEYITAYDKIYYNKKSYYDLPDGTSIIEIAKGRYDFRLNTAEGVFATNEFLNPTPVQQLIKMKLKSHYSCIVGAVPAVPLSDNGPWHRDIYPLFDDGDGNNGCYDDSIETKIMPPFYYTLLIPLENITLFNGSTEFILSSHKSSYEESKTLPRLQVEAEAGSVILFDGRVFHRGRENQSTESRMVLYQVYHKNWYNDY